MDGFLVLFVNGAVTLRTGLGYPHMSIDEQLARCPVFEGADGVCGVAIGTDGSFSFALCQSSGMDAILGEGILLLMAAPASLVEIQAGSAQVAGAIGWVWVFTH